MNTWPTETKMVRPYGLDVVNPYLRPYLYNPNLCGGRLPRMEPAHGEPVFFLVPPGFDAPAGWHAGRYHTAEKAFQMRSTVDHNWINVGPTAFWMPQPMMTVEHARETYRDLARSDLATDRAFEAICVRRPPGGITGDQWDAMPPSKRHRLATADREERKAEKARQQCLWFDLAEAAS